MKPRDNIIIASNGSLDKQEQELWLRVAERIAGIEWHKVAEHYYEDYRWITIPLVLKDDGQGLKAVPGVKGWPEVEVKSKEELKELWYGYTRVKELSKDEADHYGRAKKVEKKGKRNWLTCGIALVCGQKSGVFVLDVDKVEDFEQRTGLKVEDLKKLTLYAKTKSGGYHFFFRYEPSIKTTQLKGFDIKSDGGLVNLEPTTLPNKQGEIGTYEFIKDYHTEPQKAPPELLEVLRKFAPTKEERLYNTFKAPKPQAGDLKYLQEIAEAVGQLYRAGLLNGYEDIDTAFLTGLLQLGYGDKEIKFALQVIYGEQYQESLTDYMINRAKVRLESGQEVRGLGSFIHKLESILKEHPEYRDEIDKVLAFLRQDIYIFEPIAGHVIVIKRTGRYYGVGNDGLVYELKEGKDPKPLGPYVELVATIKGDGEAYNLFLHDGEEFLASIVNDSKYLETIKAHTGIIVVKPSGYMEWLSYQTPQKKLKLYKWLGWDAQGFRHPSLREDGYYYITEAERFTTLGDAQAQWNFVKNVLASSGLLNVLFLASFSAPVLYLAGMPNYVVYVSGKTGTGKTTACKLACNLFYDNKLPITLFATVNALERTLSSIKDLPILFDEDELRKDENLFTHLIYMFHSGRGKRRAKATLEVEQANLRGVLFLTGEHSLEQNLQTKRVKLGAYRRALEIAVEDKQDWGVDFGEMIEALEHIGHVGLEWIRFLSGLNEAEIREAFDHAWRENRHKLIGGLETIGQSLYATAVLLRQFGFEVNTEALDRYFEGVKEEVEEKIGKREIGWLNELMAWVNANIRDFERKREVRTQNGAVDEPMPADRYKGRIEDGWLMITTEAFRSFCRERDIDVRDFRNFLSKQGAIRKFGKNLYGRLYGPAGQAYHYYINLRVVNKLLEEAFDFDSAKQEQENKQDKDLTKTLKSFKNEVERLYHNLPVETKEEIESRGGYELEIVPKDENSIIIALNFDGLREEYTLHISATEEEVKAIARLLVDDLAEMANDFDLPF